VKSLVRFSHTPFQTIAMTAIACCQTLPDPPPSGVLMEDSMSKCLLVASACAATAWSASRSPVTGVKIDIGIARVMQGGMKASSSRRKASRCKAYAAQPRAHEVARQKSGNE
jgi:hypothetical protein